MKTFMQSAYAEALKAYEKHEVPVGAVIVFNDQVIAAAHNLMVSNCDPTAHCEISIIKKAADILHTTNLSGCSLYVTMEPCPMCMGAIILSKISKVVFACDDYQFGACGGYIHLGEHPSGKRIEIYGGIMEKECSELLKQFFKELR